MRTFFLFFFFLIPNYVLGYPLDELRIFPEDVVSIYDGDTITVNVGYVPDVFGSQLSVRILGIDTPEMRSECATKEQRDREKALAVQAREIVAGLLSTAKTVRLTGLDRDKYFRLLANVIVDGQSVADVLIAKGLAVPYSGGTKIGWCSI